MPYAYGQVIMRPTQAIPSTACCCPVNYLVPHNTSVQSDIITSTGFNVKITDAAIERINAEWGGKGTLYVPVMEEQGCCGKKKPKKGCCPDISLMNVIAMDSVVFSDGSKDGCCNSKECMQCKKSCACCATPVHIKPTELQVMGFAMDKFEPRFQIMGPDGQAMDEGSPLVTPV